MSSWTLKVSLPGPMAKNVRVHGYSIEEEGAIALSRFGHSGDLSRSREPALPAIRGPDWPMKTVNSYQVISIDNFT